jgi:hypothetical protein
MGMHDRRRSLKMRRRKAQAKKKGREARKLDEHKARVAALKKPAKKSAAASV